jgi:Holliday junction resolvase RusA-like endonuclease
MPKTWTKKKKVAMEYQLHKNKPDADNCIKLLVDTMFKKDSASGRFRNDSCVSSIMCVKYYVPDHVQPGYRIVEFEKRSFIDFVLKKPT